VYRRAYENVETENSLIIPFVLSTMGNIPNKFKNCPGLYVQMGKAVIINMENRRFELYR
jgi:hypothetical protein